MILLSRLKGDEFWVNPDLIERLEPHPDSTVVTMREGPPYVVQEDPVEIRRRIIEFNGSVLAWGLAHLDGPAPAQLAPTEDREG